MNKNALVVSLFVHDIKAPLAVIELGATRLLEQMKHDDSNGIEMDLLDTVVQLKKRSVTLLNQILEMDLSEQPGDDIKKIPGKPGRLSGFFALFKSIVPLKETLEDAIDLKDTLEKLRDLLSAILTSISTFETMMTPPKDTIKNGHATLDRILRNAKTAVHFADNAMAVLLSRQPSAVITPCKISSIIQQAMIDVFDLIDPITSQAVQEAPTLTRLKKELARKELYLDVDDQQWESTFQGDDIKIKQVLVNLLMNAVKFRKLRVVLGVTYKKEQLIFSVTDDGKGISREEQQHIFKKQFQVKSEEDFPIRGHGIGLAGAQALLEKINGHLLLESFPGEGASFSAVLDGIDENRQ